MSCLIDCDERTFFCFRAENIWCWRSSNRRFGGDLSKKESCRPNPWLKPRKRSFINRSFTNESVRSTREGARREMLRNKPVCPLNEAFGQNSENESDSEEGLSSLGSVRQMSAVYHLCPSSKSSIHMWPSNVWKKGKIPRWAGPVPSVSYQRNKRCASTPSS